MSTSETMMIDGARFFRTANFMTRSSPRDRRASRHGASRVIGISPPMRP